MQASQGAALVASTSRRIVIMMAAIWLVLNAAVPEVAAAQTFDMRRGVGLFGWFEMPAHASGPNSPYAQHPFDRPRYTLTAEDLSQLHALGIDGVRLAVDPGPLLEAQPSQRYMLIEQIERAIRYVNRAGISVIFDLHAEAGRWPTEATISTPKAESFLRYKRLVADIAYRLGKGFDPRNVALELVNEPDRETPELDEMLQALYRTARGRAPDLTLIVQGGCCDSVDGLVALKAATFDHDPNVIYDFHFYDPGIFAQQGEHANPALSNFALLPYPVSTQSEADAVAAFERNLAAGNLSPVAHYYSWLKGRIMIRRYYMRAEGPPEIEAQFDRVMTWSQAQHVRPAQVLVGEFGAVRYDGQRGAAPADRLRWMEDVRKAAERRGFRWSVWNYRGDMSIMNGSAPDPGAIRALGLAP